MRLPTVFLVGALQLSCDKCKTLEDIILAQSLALKRGGLKASLTNEENAIVNAITPITPVSVQSGIQGSFYTPKVKFQCLELVLNEQVSTTKCSSIYKIITVSCLKTSSVFSFTFFG